MATREDAYQHLLHDFVLTHHHLADLGLDLLEDFSKVRNTHALLNRGHCFLLSLPDYRREM